MKHWEIKNKEDRWHRADDINERIISLNGIGRCGKTTQSQKLADSGHGIHIPIYTVRDNFDRHIYTRLDRDDAERQTEILDVPSIAWIGFEFHWRVKPILNGGDSVIFDHYIADFYVDALNEVRIDYFIDFIKNSRLPSFEIGHHIYLDINYDTYQKRSEREDLISGGALTNELEVPKSIFNTRRKRYHKLVDAGYITQINGMQNIDAVFSDILRTIKG